MTFLGFCFVEVKPNLIAGFSFRRAVFIFFTYRHTRTFYLHRLRLYMVICSLIFCALIGHWQR